MKAYSNKISKIKYTIDEIRKKKKKMKIVNLKYINFNRKMKKQ